VLPADPNLSSPKVAAARRITILGRRQWGTGGGVPQPESWSPQRARVPGVYKGRGSD